MICDYLFYAKSLILAKKSEDIESVLNDCFHLISKVNVKRISSMINSERERMENKLQGGEEEQSQRTRRSAFTKFGRIQLGLLGLKDSRSHVRFVFLTYSTLAAMYNVVGNQTMTEKCYQYYIKRVEQ